RYAPFAAPWNFAGFPAAAVPAGMHSSGLPLSVQLVTAPGGEALLLSVAKYLENLRPWRRHPPLTGL
ncbi:MAG: amidase, partial [Gemmatimonadetes bacterium]|nr:amidase [Gemmatimonadota bacterium]